MSLYTADPPSPSGPSRVAGSDTFMRQYLDKRVKAAEAIMTASDAKLAKKIASETAEGPSSEPGSYDLGGILSGAGQLAKGLSSAFKPQTAAGSNPYAMDFSSWNPSQQYGMDLGNIGSFWDSAGSAGGFDAGAFSAPAGTFDFGLGNNFGTVFGG